MSDQHGVGVFAALLAAGVSAVIVWQFSPHVHQRGQSIAVALAVGCGTGISALHGHPALVEHEAATRRYAVTVVGDVVSTPTGNATLLAVPSVGTVRATLRSPVDPGERLLLRGRLEPFDVPRNPGEPSIRAIERASGIAGQFATPTLLARASVDPLDSRAWAARLRAGAVRRVRAVIAEPQATILAGALWGSRGELPGELRADFVTTGTVHILITAGLHLGVIAALCFAICRLLAIPRVASCLITGVCIFGYVWWAGAHLPTQRAAAMAIVALAARACGARITSWNALAVAGIVVCTIWPASVDSASFALSFSCLAAIVLFAEPLGKLLAYVPLPARIREAIALTVATQLGTWPLSLALFSTLAPYAILANAIVIPLAVLALGGGILTLICPLVAPLETLLLSSIITVVQAIAALPGAHAVLATPPALAIATYDLFAIAAGIALTKNFPLRAALFLGCGIFAVALPTRIQARAPTTITFLDVNQADATVVQTADGHTLLIDSGGMLERGTGLESSAEAAGARIVLAYLQRRGIRDVDLLVITHPHGDHVGGCAPIISALHVRALIDSGQAYAGRAYRDCINTATLDHVPVVRPAPGLRWEATDGTQLEVLAPAQPFLTDTGDDVNENSIVAKLTVPTHDRPLRVLLTGDAGMASEARLLAAGVDLHADVLKVGHHGSAYASSAAFLAAVAPTIAIISDGRHNPFGHPAPATLDRLRTSGAQIYRTDQCGAIIIDGMTRRIETMLPCDSSRMPAIPTQR
jgi:competence protein ComEC